MAVAMRMEFGSMGLDDYDAVCGALNFPADWPDGLLAHGAAERDGHLVVTDVGASRDRFDHFLEARLQGAIASALGDNGKPPDSLDEIPLHTFRARETANV